MLSALSQLINEKKLKIEVLCTPKGWINIQECLECSFLEKCYGVTRELFSYFIRQTLDHWDREKISASIISNCLSKRIFELRYGIKLYPQIIRDAIRGHIIHYGIQKIYKEELPNSKTEVEVMLFLEHGRITGHADILDIENSTIYEIKTTSRNTPSVNWLIQAAIYKLALKVRKAYILLYDIKTQTAKKFKVAFDEEKLINWLNDRILKYQVAKLTLNINDLEEHGAPTNIICKKCPYYSECPNKFKKVNIDFIRYERGG